MRVGQGARGIARMAKTKKRTRPQRPGRPKCGSIDFKVSVNPAQTYTIDIYRLGWYGGLGGRLMLHVNPTLGFQQPVCPTNATTGLIECNWSTSYTLSVPTSWTTGAYVALLTNSNNYQNYVPF